MNFLKRSLFFVAFLSFTFGVQDYSLTEAMKVVKALEKSEKKQSSAQEAFLEKFLITESELNSYIAYRIETEKEEIMKELRLKLFKGNKIEGMTVIDLRGQKIPKFLRPQMTLFFRAKLEVANGRARLVMKDLFLEGQRVQPRIIDIILMIAAKIDDSIEVKSINDWYELPYGIKDIETQRGKAILFY